MKYILFLAITCSATHLYAQQQQQQDFIPAPTSMYGNVLQYHYSQSQWYYKDLVENQYTSDQFTRTSDKLLDIMMKVKPKVDRTKSILDVYNEENRKLYYYNNRSN